MSDENNNNQNPVVDDDGGEGQPDPKQIKGEFDRKFGNLQEQLKSQAEQLSKLTESIIAANTKPQPAAEEVDPMLEPVKYKERIKQEAVHEATAAVTQTLQRQQATQGEIARIASEYPEFGKDNSEASTLALQKFQKLSPHLKGTPEGARLVMLETANELGLEKASRRRTQVDDDDAASGGGSSSQRPTRQSKSKIDPATLAFAEMMGKDISDPEFLKSLEKTAQNRGGKWGSYR